MEQLDIGGIEGALDKLPSYATLEEAAVHAMMRGSQCSHYYECGGAIAQRPDGKYVVGPISSDSEGDSTHISHTVPPGWKLVADYHTHTCLKATHYVDFFSPQDVMGYLTDNIVGFMGDMCTGDVHEFVPGKDSPNDVRVAENLYLTHGRVIGHFPVSGIIVEPDTGL